MRIWRSLLQLTMLLLLVVPLHAAPVTVFHTRDFQSPVRADPDDLLMIAGSGFDTADRVVYAEIDSATPAGHPARVPQRSNGHLGTAPIVQVGQPPYAITIRIPMTLRAGAPYRLWVVNAKNEWSDAVSINDPRPQWFSPTYVFASQDLANLGRRLRVIGRNLATGATKVTAIRLEGPRTYVLATVAEQPASDTLTRYLAEALLPTALVPGVYTVSVHRSDLGWTQVPGQHLQVRPDPAVDHAFMLGDPQYGACRPDDDVDDSACFARVLDAVRQIGGGTVLIPQGTWRLSTLEYAPAGGNGFVLGAGVRIQGMSGRGAVIVRHEPLDARHVTPLLTLTGRNSVSQLIFRDDARFSSLAESRPMLRLGIVDADRPDSQAAREVADVVITANTFAPVGIAIIDDAYRPLSRIFITDNSFGAYSEALNLPGGNFHAGGPFRIDDSVVRGNRFMPGSYIDLPARQGTIASEVGAARRMDFSANIADGASIAALQNADDPHGFRAAFFWNLNNSVEDLLVSGNQISCSGDKDGDGEAIALDNSGNTLGFDDAPRSGRAGSDWLTISASRLSTQNGRASPGSGAYVGHWLQVVAGPGVGQVRRIVGYEEDLTRHTVRFRIGPAWDVLPLQGVSRIAIGREFRQVLVIANHIDHRSPRCLKSNLTGPKGGGIAIAGPSADSVIEGNSQFDSDGIYFNQSYATRTPSCTWCDNVTTFQTGLEIRGNLIDGEYDWTSDCSFSGIMATFGSSPTPESPPPLGNFGVSISHNNVAHADGLGGGAIDFALSWYSGPPPGRWPYLQNALIFHNEIRDVAGSVPRPSCHYAPADRAAIRLGGNENVRDTVLYANRCRRVDHRLVDSGRHTTRLCRIAGEESCECSVN